jgi:hypothetical protein
MLVGDPWVKLKWRRSAPFHTRGSVERWAGLLQLDGAKAGIGVRARLE